MLLKPISMGSVVIKPQLLLNSVQIRRNHVDCAQLDTKPYRLHKLDQGPATNVTLTRTEALDIFRKMHTIRRMEVAVGNLYKEKIIRGFCHLYSGQEACAVGMKSVLRPQDSVITSYRAHGWAYLMGVDLKNLLCELTGRKNGCSGGKGGSMHMYGKKFYGGNGIVGAQVPLGAGIALAHKYTNDNGVCLTLYGDGAANQGQVFEAFNMAMLWRLPCIFVCENNGYGMGTSADRAAVNTEYYTRGDCVPGIWVDGMDVLAVREATKFAIEMCMKGNGPILIETATYRYSGHSMSDPGTSYRSRDEIQQVRQTRDPIASFKERIIEANLVTAEEIKKIEAETKPLIEEAVKIAKVETKMPLEELTTNIYRDERPTEIRNVTVFETLKNKVQAIS